MASDRRIILSNWRTVILHEDFVIPERRGRGREEGKRGEEGGVERRGKSKMMKRRRERGEEWNGRVKGGKGGYVCETS